MSKKVIIMGAAGRDFHNFNVFFRGNPKYRVVCFTATQIPNITGRKYPKELTGKFYPKGIPIYPEEELPKLIKEYDVDLVVLAYSDLSYDYLMHRASIVNAAGADFELLGPKSTMLKSKKPVISICAVRTGCGKSQTTRKVCEILKGMGKKVVVIRHPMPYGDLKKQIWERFETLEDLDKYNCTIEEREEYESHIRRGNVVYAGVDYGEILKRAEREADVIVWDGGNNDFPFYKSNLHIVLVDPFRSGHELKYYPGEVNLRMADLVVINKENTAKKEWIKTVEENTKKVNPKARIVHADSIIKVDNPSKIKNKKVLVVEDGPTVTHGGMKYGAGYFAAKGYNCRIVDPRPFAVGSIRKTFEKYNHLEKVLPAMGYGKKQLKELEKTIENAKCDAVVIGTPIDLRKIIKINKPAVRVHYELKEKGKTLEKMIKKFLK